MVQALKAHPQARPVCYSTRLLMAEVFGISVIDQMAIEEFYARSSCVSPIPLQFVRDYVPDLWLEVHEKYVHDQPRMQFALNHNELLIKTGQIDASVYSNLKY